MTKQLSQIYRTALGRAKSEVEFKEVMFVVQCDNRLIHRDFIRITRAHRRAVRKLYLN